MLQKAINHKQEIQSARRMRSQDRSARTGSENSSNRQYIANQLKIKNEQMQVYSESEEENLNVADETLYNDSNSIP